MDWIWWLQFSVGSLLIHLASITLLVTSALRRVRALENRLNEPSTEDEP